MSEFDYSKISPGVRDLVKALRELHGMNTIDSGDGSNLANGMVCAIPQRHVFMKVELDAMVEATEYLTEQYPEAHVECSYSPGESAIVMLWPDGATGGMPMTAPLEELADAQHKIWSHWMTYQFSKCETAEEVGAMTDDDDVVIPAEFVRRWLRQANTPYAELIEDERESDRRVVREFLSFVMSD